MEVSTSIEIAKNALLLTGFILAVGSIAGLVAQKLSIPDVPIYPRAGMVIGSKVAGFIPVNAD